MPNIPIRGVGDIGIVTDIQSYDTPITAWSEGRNVRFRNKTVSRSSAFKSINETLTFTNKPMALIDASLSGDQGCIVIPQLDGIIRQLENGVQANVSPSPAWGAMTSRVTTCRLGSVTYINNQDGGPLYRNAPANGAFARLPGWTATDRCLTLRAFRDYVIGLNVSKSSLQYPNMVKWSDVVQVGAPPPNWDVASLSSHAGENVLNDARGELVDGLTLGNIFILYGSEETYRMAFVGTPLIFATEKLFDDLGVNGQDCAIEIDGKHYVFGADGIYMHDGVQKISISEGKVSERIFGRMDYLRRNQCFVFQNPRHSEILFCYPSKSSEAVWALSDTAGCNEAAVYNYTTGTWSFVDMPGVTSSILASLPSDETWTDLGTWSSLAGSWRSFEGAEPALPIVVGVGNTTLSKAGQLYFYDDAQDGFIANTVDTSFLFDGYISTWIKDTDEIGGTLISNKLVNSIAPQAMALTPESYLTIQAGSSRTPATPITWSNPQNFYSDTDYKKDFRVTGRYIAIKFGFPAAYDTLLSGYDLDISVVAAR